MNTEYVLPFTGVEIEEKLGKIDNLATISWKDLEDKPFGEGVEEIEFVEEITVGAMSYVDYKDSGAVLQEGMSYAVYFDGERYECIATLGDSGSPELTAEPFKFIGDLEGYGYFAYKEGDGVHTVSIFAIHGVTIPISEEYIPDTIARTDENGKLLNSVLPEGYPMKASVAETLLSNETVSGDGLSTPDSIGLEVGKAYTVIWDGVEYPDLIAYQNDFLISLPSGLPFEVGDCPEDGFCDIIPSDGAEHTITIMGQSSTVIPMSEEYLPKATAIADLTEAPTAADFNNLLAALRAAGYMAE